MDPLYDELLHHDFEDSSAAVEFCRNLAFNAGFTVKQEASANRVSIPNVMFLYFGDLIGASFFVFYKHVAPLIFILFYFIFYRVWMPKEAPSQ
jgi:hypothetical protein